MKFIDGITLHQNTANQLIDSICHLRPIPANGLNVMLITDSNGNAIDRVKLFEETLTDGSKAFTIELHFDSSEPCLCRKGSKYIAKNCKATKHN